MYHFARSISLSLLQRDACLLTIMLLIDRDLDLFDIGVPLGFLKTGWNLIFDLFPSLISRKYAGNSTSLVLCPPPPSAAPISRVPGLAMSIRLSFLLLLLLLLFLHNWVAVNVHTHTHIYFRTSSIAHIVLLLCTTIIPFRRLRCAVRQTCVVPAAHLLTLCDAILNTAARMVFSQRGKSVCHVFFFFTFFHLDDKFESSRWVHSAILEVLDKSYLCCRHRYVDWRR